jgi:hypothetical protein
LYHIILYYILYCIIIYYIILCYVILNYIILYTYVKLCKHRLSLSHNLRQKLLRSLFGLLLSWSGSKFIVPRFGPFHLSHWSCSPITTLEHRSGGAWLDQNWPCWNESFSPTDLWNSGCYP